MKISKEQAQEWARGQEAYYKTHKLYYGLDPKENGDASWWLALNGHQISPAEFQYLDYDLPYIIGDFHHLSAGLLRRSLLSSDLNPALADLRKQLTAGVPDETIEIYQEALKRNVTGVFSSRPDTIQPAKENGSLFPIIEYNVDGTADKGNTEGVNQVLVNNLGEKFVGKGLARLFVEGVRQKIPEKDSIVVATILPEGYRNKYDAQNIYFANRASEVGRESNVRWLAVHTSDVDIKANGLFTSHGGETIKIDIVDSEFKLPGHNEKVKFEKETAIMQATLDGTAILLGTPLPLGDKILLSTPFNPDLRDFILEDLGEQAEERLAAVQAAHAETHVLSGNQNEIIFDGVSYSLDDLVNLKYQPGFVLKTGGDSEHASESKGVFFSHGRGSDRWTKAFDEALAGAAQGDKYWVMQKVIQPRSFDISTIPNSRSMPKEMLVPNRLAPYYGLLDGRLQLGNILVTAGTDREVDKLKDLQIHGQKHNTYQGVVVK